MQRVENYLKLLLQGFGAVTAIALVPFVMPRSWMAMVHEWLGMGVLPDKPVVEYLARTTCGLTAERLLAREMARVRFPAAAPISYRLRVSTGPSLQNSAHSGRHGAACQFSWVVADK